MGWDITRVCVSGELKPFQRELSSARHFAEAHAFGKDFGEMQHSMLMLHEQREYLQMAACYEAQAEMLERHNEGELADIAQGKAQRYEELHRDSKARQVLPISVVIALIEGEAIPEETTDITIVKKKRKNRKKKNNKDIYR